MSQNPNPFDAIEAEAGKAVFRGVLRALIALRPAEDVRPCIELTKDEYEVLALPSTPATPARKKNT